ncbi:histone-lysine N-methyltransferase EHMT2 [Leptinotarsa decemlineata]|uniref:histone-lysine N-methyltransferase EHMT2 n=1 Tax=Leptinotarsa decemlineata TaxID=7539 RepID=UPI003D307A7C
MNQSESVFQSEKATFINELINKMKNQFNNKPEDVIETEPEATFSEVCSDYCPKESGKDESEKCPNLKNESMNDTIGDLSGKPRLVLHFKKPNNESPIKSKNSSPTKRSVRLKSSSSDEKKEESPKRSSRRRSKDCRESVLQSAIARKEKSYNESVKPQRLSRQLKPTQKMLENIAFARQEKKVKSSRNPEKSIDNGLQSSSEWNSNKRNKKNSKSRGKESKKFKTGLTSEKDSESDESFSSDSEKNLEIVKEATRKSHRKSINLSKDESGDPPDPSPNIADQANDFPDDPECSSVGAQLIAAKLCLCTQKTSLYCPPNENDIIHCSAVDSIGEKLIGCSREVNIETTPLLRPSQRVPYLTLCELHKNRLIRHNCCPTCGIFCTQGRFVECDAKHQYHRNCQIYIGNVECCPHCGSTAPCQDILIKMQCSNKPVFLPVQKSHCQSAKMTFPNNKENPKCPTPLLLPMETFQVFDTALVNGQNFTENDVIDAVRDEDITKLASIIASDTIDMHFRLSDFNDGTPLHYAAQKGFLKVCHLLVSSSLEVDDFDKEQNTPLMLAVSSNNNDVVQYLVRTGASITIKGTDGMTPLHVAAKCGNLGACKILLQAGATIKNYVNCQDDGGWTPLVWACENGYGEVADLLINKGADPLLRDVEHNEALHWASFSGSSHIVELLLNKGCNVNTVNAHGETPLHIGAREDRYNSVIVLLARGANVFLVNKNNETPLECVPEEGVCYSVIALNVQMQSITGCEGTKYKTILSNDISKGREMNPIQCVNTFDDESEPKNFVYITKSHISTDGYNIDDKLSLMQSCSCEERCTSDYCECGKLSLGCWYDEEGKLLPDFNFADSPIIFECNDACSCNAITCRNRVVQRGLQQRFQLYKTDLKGWGVKTLRFIPKGSYVCEYVGEILTDVEADRREDDTFFFDLDNRGLESFCVDAKYYGNFARFINHSCTPNLQPIKVFTDHQDLRFPRIALFAFKDITLGEELSFDYGKKFWLIKCKSFACQCGSADCKYSEETMVEMDEEDVS